MTDGRPSKLDELLDSALAEYGSAEPRPGLEGRVVASLRAAAAEPAPHPGGWRAVLALLLRPAAAGVLAAATLAAVLAFYFVAGGRERPTPPSPRVAAGRGSAASAGPEAAAPLDPKAPAAAAGPAAPAPSASKPPTLLAVRSSPRPVRGSRVVRLDSFPAHSPLTEQERLLLAYVSAAPREEVVPRSGFLDEPAPLPPLPSEPASRP